MSNEIKCPDPFLEVRVKDVDLNPTLLAMCAGYENNQWRAQQFASHLLEWLPEFCLKYSEIVGIGAHNMVKLLRNAATFIYDTEKVANRGEIGEIILHAIIRQEYNTYPFISKIFFKDSPNVTVKGFDCVHVVNDSDKLELWLGEAKFYKNFNEASREVCIELQSHIENDYLRKEFIAICNRIEAQHFASQRILNLLNRNTSLDKIFDHLVFPVLITYESDTINNFSRECEELKEGIKKEVYDNYRHFVKKVPPIKSIIHLILVPLGQKEKLIEAFDNEIRKMKW